MLTIVLTLVGLAVLDWRFLLAALLAVPIQLHTVRWYVGRAGPLYARQRVAGGRPAAAAARHHRAAPPRSARSGWRDEHLERVAERSLGRGRRWRCAASGC